MRKSNNFKVFHKLSLLLFFVAALILSSCTNLKLRKIVNNLNADSYKDQLEAYANSLAEEWYSDGGPTGWIVKDSYIINDEVKSEVLSDMPAKKISCTVHVIMEGALGLGIRSGSVDIWVEGTLKVNDFDGENYNVTFSRGDHKKIKVEGGLTRRG